MTKHVLYLEVPETNNAKVFRVVDISGYAENLPVTCGTLQITSPGFNLPVGIEVTQNFNLVLNACTLGLASGSNCNDNLVAIPDGIYVIRYSVSPNDKVYVEYNHLRITQSMNKYYHELAKLEVAGCEPSADIKAKLMELRWIEAYLKAAKSKVEYGHDPAAGMAMLVYAQSVLNSYALSVC